MRTLPPIHHVLQKPQSAAIYDVTLRDGVTAAMRGLHTIHLDWIWMCFVGLFCTGNQKAIPKICLNHAIKDKTEKRGKIKEENNCLN